jgi:hypothetical protein
MALKSVTLDNFDLPDEISDDDENLLSGILTAMYAGELCSSYKILVTPTGFIIRGSLTSEDNYEIDLDDLQFIVCVNPVRIERIAICNSGGKTELVIKILNMKQRIMVSTTVCNFIANKKRKYTQIQQ